MKKTTTIFMFAMLMLILSFSANATDTNEGNNQQILMPSFNDTDYNATQSIRIDEDGTYALLLHWYDASSLSDLSAIVMSPEGRIINTIKLGKYRGDNLYINKRVSLGDIKKGTEIILQNHAIWWDKVADSNSRDPRIYRIIPAQSKKHFIYNKPQNAVYKIEADDGFKFDRGYNDITYYITKTSGTIQTARDMQREPVLGNPDGKVKIVAYMSYTEPYSKKAWLTMKRILDNYDEASLELSFYPNGALEPDYAASQAGECVLSNFGLNVFEKFSDKMFKHSGTLLDSDILESVKEIVRHDSSRDIIASCIESKEFFPEVLDDMQRGNKLGVSGTPVFFINGKRISGAKPYEAFVRVIDDILGTDEILQITPDKKFELSKGDTAVLVRSYYGNSDENKKNFDRISFTLLNINVVNPCKNLDPDRVCTAMVVPEAIIKAENLDTGKISIFNLNNGEKYLFEDVYLKLLVIDGQNEKASFVASEEIKVNPVPGTQEVSIGETFKLDIKQSAYLKSKKITVTLNSLIKRSQCETTSNKEESKKIGVFYEQGRTGVSVDYKKVSKKVNSIYDNKPASLGVVGTVGSSDKEKGDTDYEGDYGEERAVDYEEEASASEGLSGKSYALNNKESDKGSEQKTSDKEERTYRFNPCKVYVFASVTLVKETSPSGPVGMKKLMIGQGDYKDFFGVGLVFLKSDDGTAMFKFISPKKGEDSPVSGNEETETNPSSNSPHLSNTGNGEVVNNKENKENKETLKDEKEKDSFTRTEKKDGYGKEYEESCNGCLFKETCLSVGLRTKDSSDEAVYCSVDKEMMPQKNEGEVCQNNFECLTNSCMSGTCKDLSKELEEQRGLLQKIISWFSGIF